MQLLAKELELDRDYYVEGYASASVEDLENDIITEEALLDAVEQLKNEPYNKVFLNHDVKQIPIGRIEDAEVRNGKLWVRVKLNKNHELFEKVWNSLKDKFLDAFSIGFKILESEKQGDKRFIKRIQILEVSLVGIPANPEARVEEVYMKDFEDFEMKGVVPGHPFKYGKDKESGWSKPTLRDFTDKTWEELSNEEKRRIAGHFAWAPKNPPERFTDLKLPHHDPKTHAVVWRGVVAAMAALFGARGGVDIPSEDRKKVYNHLASHYKEFGNEPPEFKFLEEFATEFFQEEVDLKSPTEEESTMIEGKIKELEAELEKLKKENEELKQKLRAYEEKEKAEIIEKVKKAADILKVEVNEEELKEKDMVEIKLMLADFTEKLLEAEEKKIEKVEVDLEDSKYVETQWGKAEKAKLEELRRMVGIEVK